MNAQPDETKIACPHCGQHILIEASMLGTELQCPTCNQSFTAPEADAGESKGTGSGEAAEKNVSANNDATSPETTAPEPFETEAAETSTGEPAMKGRTPAVLAGRIVSGLKHIAGQVYTRTRKGLSALSKRNRRIAAAAAVLLVLFVVFGLSGEDRGIPIPAEEIIQGKRDCSLIEKGRGFRTNGRNLISYKLPLESQADRISFDIRPHDDKEVILRTKVSLHTGTGMWAPSIDIPDSRTKLKREHWTHVDVRLREKDALVSVGGKTKKIPRPAGVRFSMLAIGNETDFSVRNMKVHPSRRHREAVKTFQDAIALAGEENLGKKVKMLGKAAEMGLTDAQVAYSLFGRMGWGGVSLTPKEQERWMLKAAEQGDPEAQELLGRGYFYGGGDIVSKNERHALKWLRAAAEGGNVNAMFECADLLLHGREIDHDGKEAQLLLDKCTAAILFGEADDLSRTQKGRAYFYSAYTYITGEAGAEQDKSKGLDRLRKAADYGDSEAIAALKKLR